MAFIMSTMSRAKHLWKHYQRYQDIIFVGKKMKTYMVRYTEDCGKTCHTELVNAENITFAYNDVYIRIPKSYDIIDIFEII
jgi:hypothetical protein